MAQFSLKKQWLACGIIVYTSIPQVGEKWLAVVAASDSCRGHDSRWLS
jgi:hypothetical protein